jgi:hypothetical protein
MECDHGIKPGKNLLISFNKFRRVTFSDLMYLLCRPASFNSSQLKTCKMKSKLLAATIAVALIITFIACNWLKSTPRSNAFDIHGEWIIDSMDNKGSDSSKDLGLLVLAMASKDSLPIGIRFNDDSTFQYTNTGDSAKGKFYLSSDESSLFLKEDSTTHQFNFIEKSDSAVSLSSVDSVFYYLKRK